MTTLGRLARGAAVVSVVLGVCAAAQAQAGRRVVVILGAERATEIAEAVRLELAARGLEMLVTAPPSDPGGPLARAAGAQESARAVGAEATVWIESAAVGGGASVRAVGVDDDTVRHAPLPAPLATVEARVVALVGASLLDEIAAGREGEDDAPVTVRIAVDVDAPGRSVAIAAGAPGTMTAATAPPVAPPAAPPTAPPIAPPRAADAARSAAASSAPAVDDAVDTSDLPRIPRDGWNLETAVMFAGVAGALQATVSRWIDDAWRIGPTASVALVWADDLQPAFTLGGTLLRAGRARSGRFDFGLHAGLVVVISDDARDSFVGASSGGAFGESSGTYVTGALYGWTAEALFGWGWELSSSLALDLRFALGTAQVDGEELVPVAWAALALELPL